MDKKEKSNAPTFQKDLEPSSHEPGRFPWNPSPMLWHTGEAFAYKQTVDAYINDIISTAGPSDLDENVREAIRLNYFSTQMRLMQHNFEAHEHMMAKIEVVPDESVTILEKAKDGLASQDELMSLLVSIPFVSVELAKLTHPFGERAEYLPEMQSLVENAVVAHDGIILDPDDRDQPRVKINNHKSHNDHFIVTAREIVGQMNDVVIAKRMAYMVLADPKLGFDEHIAKKMRQENWNGDMDKWHMRVFKQTGVIEYMSEHIQDENPAFMLPISTVYYGHRLDVRKTEPPKRMSQVALKGLFPGL